MSGATLTGKVALVIGAGGAGNMGQVIARALAGAGARVMVAGRTIGPLAAFAQEIGGWAEPCDITVKADSERLADRLRDVGGGVDIVVNATGHGLRGRFEDVTEQQLRDIVDLQFVGPFLFFQALLPAVRDGGSLIQISSATATIMLDDHAPYMGTKAGMDHVMRCIALVGGPRGIRANSVSPGLTETPMTAGAKAVPGVFEAYRAKYPLGRLGTSEDIAAAVLWLADDACFMTGQNLQVNGGLTLRGNPSRAEVDASVIAATGAPRPAP
ncbi:SDR family oxidoreductase [Sphingomonas jatrophae]|uniref:NAD(P)-dependent dehydrogenase, short-chain alcohol dehydrogenase family n=1 Tax=Sphingomonas jatrophae TaxID=1166337 RepID=A0A1I6M3T9_9SPHN|nr:SDR family oxidoreductase [Sphingomonas jatrophae]SFS10350.1 NAD(P)-dependent dehydrogenase, short-chain alcohol dehydrogenase family [Sphingomonas jatrophae]